MTRQPATGAHPLGEQLRSLREQAAVPGWEAAAAARMDSTLLSKIENGKRLPTQEQLAALAKFFKVPFEPLEARRLAEDMKRWYGDHPNFAEATAILHEDAREYRANNLSPAVSKRPKPVNKGKK
jgi:transcriptional regulator with XRE-family HTH domain